MAMKLKESIRTARGVFVFGHNSEYVAPPSENSRLAMSSVGRMM